MAKLLDFVGKFLTKTFDAFPIPGWSTAVMTANMIHAFMFDILPGVFSRSILLRLIPLSQAYE